MVALTGLGSLESFGPMASSVRRTDVPYIKRPGEVLGEARRGGAPIGPSPRSRSTSLQPANW